MTLRGWCAGLGVLALIAGCSSEPEQVEPAAAGERWESCQARNDCAEGLACIENQCVQNDFPISVDAKHCYRVDCTTNEDCCEDFQYYPDAECDAYLDECQAMGGTGTACTLYNSGCVCPYLCHNDLCIRPDGCTDSSDCYDGIGMGYCENGLCYQCDVDIDCLQTDARCVDHMCEIPCTRNENCAFFEECVNGDCVHVGCQDARECIFRWGNPLMECHDGECTVPCENDAECFREGGADGMQLCDHGRCVFVGCTTNEQCRILLGLENETGPATAECRE